MKIVVVTGANRGIGLALCRQLALRGDQVVAACRRSSPALDLLGVEIIQGVDVARQEPVDALARRLAGRRIDLLVNNAGVLTRESLDDLDFERIRAQFEVNTLGPLRVTRALLQNLRPGSKVAILSSRAGCLSAPTSRDIYGYRMSKAALNMAGVNLAADLRGRGIAVLLLHPGFVATDMTGGTGIAPAQAAAGLLARIDALGIERSGEFHGADAERLPW